MGSQQSIGSFILPFWPLCILFMISSLVETNRAPFDLAEGESELVSGFNVEYSGMAFALFFLAEYGHIILISFLFTSFFFGGVGLLTKIIVSLFMVYFFIWVRTSYPRLRYDHLMNLLWTIFFPILLFFFFFFFFFKKKKKKKKKKKSQKENFSWKTQISTFKICRSVHTKRIFKT